MFVQRAKENKNLEIVKSDKIETEDLIYLYDVFLNKLKNTIYCICLETQEKTLTEKRETFLELSNEEKCFMLSEILHMFQCKSGSSDLRLIGGAGKAGILVMSNNITKCNQISIINQSPTGIYEQEINLKTV